MEKGLIHLYCGDGKGKTTASFGLCVRAAGQGFRVGVAQFLKPGESGELKVLSGLGNVRIFPFLKTVKFTVAMTGDEKRQARDFYTGLFEQIKTEAGKFDILLLDEIVSAVTENMIEMESLLEFLKSRPEGLEVIMTGRNPPKQLLDCADYISEIKQIRHPYEKGVKARKGIEW